VRGTRAPGEPLVMQTTRSAAALIASKAGTDRLESASADEQGVRHAQLFRLDDRTRDYPWLRPLWNAASQFCTWR
jgi:hypothetical protein